jgi:hypothetical protein
VATTIRLELKSGDVQKALNALRTRSTVGIVRALNRAAVSTRTVMVREIARDMGIRQRDVPVTIQNATATNLQATVVASGRRIPLMDFSARQTSRGVSANTGQGRKTYPGAFIATMKTGHRGVFKRKPGVGRLPIHELFGPSVPFVFNKYAAVGVDRGNEQLVKNLIHELRFATQQQSAA